MISVLLVDDHQLVRAGLASLIGSAPDLEIVGEASNGVEAVDLALATEPQVVLMDLSMPVLDGVAATTALLRERPQTRVVVLTSFSDRDRVQDAIRAGAVGYLLKDCEPAELLAGIRSAADGYVPIDPRVAAALLPGAGRDGEEPKEELSPREAEVLALVAKGMANKQIARALGISERTVKAHLGSVFKAIGVGDRTSAALWARDNLTV